MRKKVCYLFVSIITIVTICATAYTIRITKGIEKYDVKDSEYRTDTRPLVNHFSLLEGITKAYWKSGVYGESRIGPSDIWLKGYVQLNDDIFDYVQSEYEWDETSVMFDEGLHPDLMGFEVFDWYLSKEFSEEMNSNQFIGDFYLDMRNRILYFDLSTF